MRLLKTWRTAYLGLVLSICLSGCAFFSVQPDRLASSQASSVTFRTFTSKRADLISDHVVALLSYTSSDVQRRVFHAWVDYSTLFNAELATMQREQRISANYPETANQVELDVWRQFNTTWLADMMASRIRPEDGRSAYSASVADLIFRIIDYEYKRQ